VAAGAVELDEVCFLSRAEFGLLAAQPALRPGDGHALAGSSPSKIGFEFGDHAEGREQQTADRVGRVVHRAPDIQSHPAGRQFVNDVAGVRDRPGEPVQLGYHQRVPAAASSQRFA